MVVFGCNIMMEGYVLLFIDESSVIINLLGLW